MQEFPIKHFLWGWSISGTGCPERLLSIHTWKYSKSNGVWSEELAVLTLIEQWDWTLPAETILWFSENLRHKLATNKFVLEINLKKPNKPTNQTKKSYTKKFQFLRSLYHIPETHRKSTGFKGNFDSIVLSNCLSYLDSNEWRCLLEFKLNTGNFFVIKVAPVHLVLSLKDEDKN